MTNWLLAACAVLLVADFVVTLKWLRASKVCLRAIEAQTKYIADVVASGNDAAR